MCGRKEWAFGLEVRETGGVIGGGGEVGGADYGYQSGTECVYGGWCNLVLTNHYIIISFTSVCFRFIPYF